MFWKCSGIQDTLWVFWIACIVFWIRCGCSGVGDVVLGIGADVLDKVRVFWCGCGCSG